VIPIWLCRPDPGIPGGDHRPSCVATVVSDDAGATWQRGAIVADTAGPILHPSEHTAAQLADGRVMLNIRSESEPHRRLVATSPDGATGWSPPAFDDALYEPVCFGSLLDLRHQSPQAGAASDLLLFSNPDSHHRPEDIRPALRFRSRENLTVKLSRDGGRTWGVERVIEPGVAGYSDLAEGPDGTLYCLYEGGAVGGRMTRNGYVACARFGLSWLTALEEPVGSREREPRIVPFRGWRDERPGEIRSQGLVNHSVGARGLNSVVLRFQPGARVELHFHNVEEQVTVIEGEALAIIDGQRHVLHPYDTTHVPAGVPHHFLNVSDAPMAIHCTYGATYVEQTFPATGEVRRHGRLPGPPAVT
jgi:quercetin dioxygenase-like cupin family protein